MISAPFEYRRASSVDEAVSLLGELGEDAKLLAGGHSLVPLMKLRLAAPTTLIDIGGVAELEGIEPSDGGFRIGALTRHVTLQNASELGVIQQAASEIADQQVRNRGTIGGSLAHGDPASDLPAVMLALDATFNVTGPEGQRSIPAGEFFRDYLTTALGPQEVMTSIDVPSTEGFGWGYEKFTRRAEDWAMVGVVALVRTDGNANDPASVPDPSRTAEDVRVGLTHMSSTPLRAASVEDALRGQPLSADAIAAAAEKAADNTEPPGDLNATPEYKAHLARVMTKRALTTASGA
ncbi:MAG TPA: xanthine dehydrogenase family protein subunit M [Thermoleophilaceae bacterium]|nr:xanthine dehydrogenase family protein subunit M [Thermoleophilaceae bacterium]